jgi:hypothetical protein
VDVEHKASRPDRIERSVVTEIFKPAENNLLAEVLNFVSPELNEAHHRYPFSGRGVVLENVLLELVLSDGLVQTVIEALEL